jgi:hypothetical protein
MNEVRKFTLCIFLFNVKNIHLPCNHFGGAEYCGVATILPMVVTLKINISLLYLGSTLLHTTRDNEMTKKKRGFYI